MPTLCFLGIVLPIDTISIHETIQTIYKLEVIKIMTTIDTSLIQLRNNLSSFVEQAHYTNTQIRLTRHNKPIARIVGEDFMQSLERLLEQDPGLRETLEIMSDKNMVEMIAESQEDARRGHVRPLIDALQE